MSRAVTVTAFGKGRFEFPITEPRPTVGDALRAAQVEAGGRRVAVNGNPVELGAGLKEGDQVSIVPRLQGG